MNSTKKSPNRWLQLAVLIFGASSIYLLPYVRWDYYSAMIEGFGVTNEQLGTMMSLMSFFMMILYFPGGWLSDKFSNRIIITVGLILTGVAGFWFATFPSYPIALAISVFWAFTTSMLFWTCLIKLTRSLGDDSEQGKIYGLLEGGRGLSSVVISLLVVRFAFQQFGEGVDGLRMVIITYSAVTVLAGILSFIVLRDHPKSEVPEKAAENEEKPKGAFILALKNPAVWLITLIFFFTMGVWISMTYMTPYLETVMGATASLAATLSIIKTYGTRIIGAPIGGVISDKVGTSKTLVVAFALMSIGSLALVMLPAAPSYLVLAVIFTMFVSIILTVNRGIYFATVAEAKIPMALTGSAVAIITAIGGTPDIFLYTIIGGWIDKYPAEQAYGYVFTVGIVSGIGGVISALLLLRYIKKVNKIENNI